MRRMTVLGSLLFSHIVLADPVHRFVEGKLAFEVGEYSSAIESFSAAYRSWYPPELLFDLALTHFKADNPYTARLYLRRYVREARLDWRRLRNHEAGKLARQIEDAIADEPTPWWVTGLDGWAPPELIR